MGFDKDKAEAYWKENISTILKLLVVWFVVSYGFGILFIDEMNALTIGGIKLGFWFAQNGSILCFVVLIFVYVKKMSALEKKYDLSE